MRSAPTLKIWMTPFASVAMLEKLALLKIALCRAPFFSRASWRRTSVTPLGGRLPALVITDFLDMILNALQGSLGGPCAATRKVVLPAYSISLQRRRQRPGSGGTVHRRASERIRV